MPELAETTTETAQEPAAATPEATTPPWGDDFDAEKAWSLIQNLRSDKEKLQKRPAMSDEERQKIAEYDRLAEASKSDLERAQEAAKTSEAKAQALLDRAVKAEVRAHAQGFADPDDAAAFLDLAKYAGSGEIDTEAIKADLADLLTRKPHLGKSPERRNPNPDPSQASGGGGGAHVKPADQFAALIQQQLNGQ